MLKLITDRTTTLSQLRSISNQKRPYLHIPCFAQRRTLSTMTSFPPPELQQLAQDIAKALKERGETVAVGETAAGGLISASLLAQPGASKYYKGGLTVCASHGL